MGYFSDLKTIHAKSHEQKVPNVSMKNGYTLMMLAQISKAKNILEIGTANGVSTLFFAKSGANITTIEKSERDLNEAKLHAETMNVVGQITFLCGDAKEIIPTIIDTFDLIFIDAMKKEYLEYFKASLPLSHKDTLFIFDDVIKFRHKMEDLFTYLKEKNYLHVTLPTDEDDGILLVLAKDAEDGNLCLQ